MFAWIPPSALSNFFFFNDTATTEIYTLSLHDALPISMPDSSRANVDGSDAGEVRAIADEQVINTAEDRKSTRLNSSHSQISYAVFCLKKKKNKRYPADASYTQPAVTEHQLPTGSHTSL